MKKEVLVLACVLILNISGIGMGEEDGDLIVAAVSHEVLKRGVQDFSDGEIVMVEKSVDVVVEEEYVSVSGSNYECSIKKELSDNFLTFRRDDAFIVYRFPEGQPFGQLGLRAPSCKSAQATDDYAVLTPALKANVVMSSMRKP